jgi:hypothetical protein
MFKEREWLFGSNINFTPPTKEELFAEAAWRPWYVLHSYQKYVSEYPALFAQCARAAPWHAIVYAGEVLMQYPDLARECASREPTAAQIFLAAL